MKYALLIYGDESAWADMTPEDSARVMDAYNRFGEEAGDRIQAGDGLQGTATATTVRVRDGERLLTDGPFAETREQLGGFYVIEAGSLDEALDWAAKIPGALNGSVEVRPVMDYEAVRGGAAQGAEAVS
jgi:hypothetical protein